MINIISLCTLGVPNISSIPFILISVIYIYISTSLVEVHMPYKTFTVVLASNVKMVTMSSLTGCTDSRSLWHRYFSSKRQGHGCTSGSVQPYPISSVDMSRFKDRTIKNFMICIVLQTAYLLLIAAMLVIRTYCDVWMIQNGTMIERLDSVFTVR